MSGLLTGAFTSMRDTVALFREHAAELETQPILVIGGGTIDEHIAAYVAADLWTTDAIEGVRQCIAALEERSKTA